jgi:hypothetical protein
MENGMLPRLGLALAIATLALPQIARADERCVGREGVAVVCSATMQFNGTCTGGDMWNSWKVGGFAPSDDGLVRPWLDYPIVVIGYELVKLQADPGPLAGPDGWWGWLKDKLRGLAGLPNHSYLNARMSWFSVGSMIQPDALIWLAPGEMHAKQMWPAGHGQPWPSKRDAKPTRPHKNAKGEIDAVGGDLIDLHGLCYGGGPVTIMLTLYYVAKMEQATPQTAPP